ncbi:MAG TPA: sulfatase/phosphatase domain-containing protein, partial [Prolixibacteraceae bacterium]|nr:sulfatase/phosphatase domain-containing protein [Prolixibacteraceae bacterium]
ENDNGSDNGLLRGQKGDVFEGGIRVPFAIQWPAKIKAGQVYDQPVISLDIFASVVAQAKNPLSTKNEIDGINLIPFLTGEKSGAPHDYLFWRKFDAKHYAVRKGNEKLILKSGAEDQFFDLDQDISEQKNLSAEKQIRAGQLGDDLKKWKSKLRDPIFLGLSHDKEYNEAHPDRFKRPSK